jgi:hypothetical protein
LLQIHIAPPKSILRRAIKTPLFLQRMYCEVVCLSPTRISPTTVAARVGLLNFTHPAILSTRRYAVSLMEHGMSNDNKSANMNDRGDSGKNAGNRADDAAQKAGQQSQDASRHQQDASLQKNDKGAQRGGSDQKSGQQSQGGSQKDSGGTQQSGSRQVADQKLPSDQEHKGSQSK